MRVARTRLAPESAVVGVVLLLAGCASPPEPEPSPPRPAWTQQLGTAAYDYARGVAIDADGNAVVVGVTRGSFPGYVNPGGADIVLAKIDRSGTVLWTVQLGGDGNDYAMGVTTDADGNIILTGYTDGALPGWINVGTLDAFIVKVDPNGNTLWTLQLGTSGADYGMGATTDASGNVTVVGTTTGTLPGESQAGGRDVFVAELTAGGSVSWTRQFGGPGDDYGQAIVTDAGDNTILAGSTVDALPGQSSAGGRDVFLVKHDGNGNELWRRQLGGAGDDSPSSIAVDGQGNTIVVGSTTDALPGLSSHGGTDIILLEHDAGGVAGWTRQLGGVDDEHGYGVAVDGKGRIVVAAGTFGTWPGLTGAGAWDVLVLARDAGGGARWASQIGSAVDDAVAGVAVDAGGHAVVAGSTQGAWGGTSNGGDFDIFVARYAP